MYLEQRVEALVSSMGRDHEEYIELTTRLNIVAAQSHSAQSSSALSPELQGFLQDSVVPQRLQERKRERQLRLSAGAAVVLALTPVSLGLVLVYWVTALLHPLTAEFSVVVSVYTILGVVVFLLVVTVRPVCDRCLARIRNTGALARFVQFAVGLVVALALAAAAGLWYDDWWRHSASTTIGEQGRRAAAFLFFTTVPGALIAAYLFLLVVNWVRNQVPRQGLGR